MFGKTGALNVDPVPEITAQKSVYRHYLALATFILRTDKRGKEMRERSVHNLKTSEEIFNPWRSFSLYPLKNIPIISLQKGKIMRSCGSCTAREI
jgi:hypothetical protein